MSGVKQQILNTPMARVFSMGSLLGGGGGSSGSKGGGLNRTTPDSDNIIKKGYLKKYKVSN